MTSDRDKRSVYRITSAQRPLSEDVQSRTRRYLITMGVRAVCFVAAILVHGPLRWVLIILAVTLPWFAVVFANAGREPDNAAQMGTVEPQPPRAVQPGDSADPEVGP